MNQLIKKHNLWSLTVLCLLRIRPMHPYEMQRLIREWHKDDFLDLKRGSLYHAIARLQKDGSIEATETRREGRRPERTIYQITEKGGNNVVQWLREMLAKPTHEPSQFVAALSFVVHLDPSLVIDRLEERNGFLDAEITELTKVLETLIPRIGRLPLVEVEYALAMCRAEAAWVSAMLGDLRAGRLAWDPQAACRHAAHAIDLALATPSVVARPSNRAPG
jgi:DNA-binding PadR family transcriptional regulator